MLEGKIAIVTGGGRGIGKEITLSLNKSGVKVIIVQRTALDDQLRSLSGVDWIYGDLSSLESIEDIYEFVTGKYGSLDIIVNNAGVMSECNIDDLGIEEWFKTMTINITFPLFLIKKLLPLLRKSNGGNIVNIGSVEGISANPNHIAYCTSKAALHGMTRSLAVDLGDLGVRCNAVAPGWIDTELNNSLSHVLTSEGDFKDKLINLHPVGRIGKAEDIASMVNFLVSDAATFITGQIMIVDGGRTTMLPMPS